MGSDRREGADVSAPDMFPDAVASPVTIERQISCVEREIRMRLKVYARWVDQKKLTQATADKELREMRAVLDTLQSLKGA
jgi:hypothetical protein